MASRLDDSVSPYLRSHASNPVDWFPWGEEAFAEAARRDVPVLISIGYATCHWCHVMARESFSDETIAARLNERFVSIKVDREEHPEVDASYLAAAGAFTANLGWPLTVFATPRGETFFAGTYFPPAPVGGHTSFTQVLSAVEEAWTDRRVDVEQTASGLANALAGIGAGADARGGDLPADSALDQAVDTLVSAEDTLFGGFGGAPKFPVAPVLQFLLSRRSGEKPARRTLRAMADSPLRDPVDGGFFRYATMRDWSDPHYERMLYDNALLLDAYARAGAGAGAGAGAEGADGASAAPGDRERFGEVAAGIADFLIDVLQREGGGFASGQDSESEIDGRRQEGVYYRLPADERRHQPAPPLDGKVLTGWNGLAIGALADAGALLGRSEWLGAARKAADHLLRDHVVDGVVAVRASLDGRASTARPTLEDTGMLADGLLRLAVASGEVDYARAAARIVDDAIAAGSASSGAQAFAVPGGGDTTLSARGLTLAVDASEGAYPSGQSAMAAAAHTLYLLTSDVRYRAAAEAAIAAVAGDATANPLGFGAALEVASRLAAPVSQLVVVVPDAEPDGGTGGTAGEAGADQATVGADARAAAARGDVGIAVVLGDETARRWAAAGFELLEARASAPDRAAVYFCEEFVCRLPGAVLPDALRRSPSTDGV